MAGARSVLLKPSESASGWRTGVAQGRPPFEVPPLRRNVLQEPETMTGTAKTI